MASQINIADANLAHDTSDLSYVEAGNRLRFDHVHFYVDRLKPLDEYKALETNLNLLATGPVTRKKWSALSGQPEATDQYVSTNRDLVTQLLTAFGWRVTASSEGTSSGTRSLVVRSPDPTGVRFLVTERSPIGSARGIPSTDASRLDAFRDSHNGRTQGVGALGFVAPSGGVESILQRYADVHPKLVVEPPYVANQTRIGEVFAYYQGEQTQAADRGTILRFVERGADVLEDTVLPGLDVVAADFPVDGHEAYADHWVSNVVSRNQVLQTYEDTLGFTSKVNFNAGVVAAGEAQIESTVTGNVPPPGGEADLLKNQEQVFLPINNAISEFGHVNMYLEQLGQGVQHIATRVEDLNAVISRARLYRQATGEGVGFLNIPASYYGRLQAEDLTELLGSSDANSFYNGLQTCGLVDDFGIVRLNATYDDVATSYQQLALPAGQEAAATRIVSHARYKNIYAVLGDRLNEQQSLDLVSNQILIDIQGDDILGQIFTAPVLQAHASEEAPFLEFIQRICSARGVAKAGCGGFGIRNFITLFLSIEVTKAMQDQRRAQDIGDTLGADKAKKAVSLFEEQLRVSNPVLTAIAEAMTAEGEALEVGDAQEASRQAALKDAGQEELQRLSEHYRSAMAALRSS